MPFHHVQNLSPARDKLFSLASLLLVYGLCALMVIIAWNARHVNGVTGDEPHYLIMANGLAQHGTLEQTVAYKSALEPPERAKAFGQPPGTKPDASFVHSVAGPHGQFNVHNIGLPLLLAIPFTIGGMVGAKLFMMLFGALIIVFAWKFSALFSTNQRHRWLAVCATCIGMPLLPAANQIYPDLMAGALAMMGLYWFSTTQDKRSMPVELLFAAAVAYLPWLQIKFGPACGVILLAVMSKIFAESRDIKRIARIVAVAGLSCLTLMAYNSYAFGKASGPYLQGALDASPASLMVFLGLFMDQNQGFLLQNPVFLIGLLGMGWLYRTRRPLALLSGFLFLSMILLNALHPNWYGGWSFSGRFGWTAVVVFMIPTLYGLLELARCSERAFAAIVLLVMLIQAYLLYHYAFAAPDLYNRASTTPFDAYAQLYPAIHSWLPALYSITWAFSHMPNYTWLTVVIVLTLAGFARKVEFKRFGLFAVAFFAIMYGVGTAITTAASSPLPPHKDEVFAAATLPSQTGRIDGSTRVAEPGKDTPGFISFGPYLPYPRSTYRITVKYSSPAARSEPVALFDVLDTGAQQALMAKELPGTDGAVGEFTADFKIISLQKAPVLEFRNLWSGKHAFKLYDISVKAVRD